MLFGYPVEPGFDLGLEQRRDRLGWLMLGGTVLCLLYLFTSRPFATELFQGSIATSLFYGDTFYVRRRAALSKLWLWKSILITLPVHALYLAVMIWSDRTFPQLMTKVAFFLAVIAVPFALESLAMQSLIDRLNPSEATQNN